MYESESQNGRQNITTSVSVAEMTAEFRSPQLLLKSCFLTKAYFLSSAELCSEWLPVTDMPLFWEIVTWVSCPRECYRCLSVWVSVWLIWTNSNPSLFARNKLCYIRFSIGKPMLDNIPSCCFGYCNSSCRKYWISLITDDDGGYKCAQNIITNNDRGNI